MKSLAFPLSLLLLLNFFSSAVFAEGVEYTWSNAVVSSAYPGLEIRVLYVRENQFAEPPKNQMWRISLKNNYQSRISINFAMSDANEILSTTAELDSGKYLDPGERDDSFAVHFVAAGPTESVLVWLGLLRIDGVLQDINGEIYSVKPGASPVSTAGNDGGDEPLPPVKPTCAASPIFGPPSYTAVVRPDTVVGTKLVTVQAKDPNDCEIVFSLTAVRDTYYFDIDEAGNVSVRSPLPIDAKNHPGFEFRAIANNGLWSGFAPVNISFVGDAEVAIDSGQVFFVENSAAQGSTFGTVEAWLYETDQSAAINYRIVAGNDDGMFSIGRNSGALIVNNATLLAALDSEVSIPLSIEATSGELTGVGEVTVVVAVNQSPVLASQSFTVPQITNQSVVGILQAIDPDAGPNPLSYRIVSGDANGVFAINQAGRLLVQNATALRDNNVALYTLKIQVSDGFQAGEATVLVSVKPNQAPVLDLTPMKGAVNHFLIGKPRAYDPDGNKLFYKIISGNDDSLFVLANGQLSFVTPPNQAKYFLGVEVSDGLAKDTGQIEISFTNKPYFSTTRYEFYVPTSKARGNQVIGAVNATDLDADPLSYSISGGFFQIDETGAIRFLPGIDNYDWDLDNYALKKNGLYVETITVSDGSFSSKASASVYFPAPYTNIERRSSNNSLDYPWYPGHCGPTIGFVGVEKEWKILGETDKFELINPDAVAAEISLQGGNLVLRGDAIPETDMDYIAAVRVSDIAGQSIEAGLKFPFSPIYISTPKSFFNYQSCKDGFAMVSRHTLPESNGVSIALANKQLVAYDIELVTAGEIHVYGAVDVDVKATLYDNSNSVVGFEDEAGAGSGFDIRTKLLPAGRYSLAVQTTNASGTGMIQVFQEVATSPSEPVDEGGTDKPKPVFGEGQDNPVFVPLPAEPVDLEAPETSDDTNENAEPVSASEESSTNAKAKEESGAMSIWALMALLLTRLLFNRQRLFRD